MAADLAESRAASVTDSRLGQALIVNATVIAAFGVVWVVKFVVFEKLLFVKRDGGEDEDLPAPLADEVVAGGRRRAGMGPPPWRGGRGWGPRPGRWT